MSHKETLLKRIEQRTARLAIVGVGYVGLPLAVEFAREGFNVLAIDVDEKKVNALNRGQSYIDDIRSDDLRPLVEGGKLRASARYSDLADVDAISICVPTPLTKTKDPDMSYVIQSVESIAKVAHPGLLVVLESTTYPGTTEEILLPRLTEGGLVVGEDVFLAFSPERIDPGNQRYGVRNTPKVVGGITPACSEVTYALYSTAVEQVILVSSPTTAEMVKLLENTFRAVNIGLVNEMALMCDKLGIDVWEVIQAASSKPFGYMPFYPGPGLGGHCIPIDPLYLSWKLKTLNYTARFIELASEINTSMPIHVLGKVTEALNDEGKAVKGARIVVLGVAYKPDVSDVRESPALDIIELLRKKGAQVVYHDPFVPSVRLEEGSMASSEYNDALLRQADCVVIVTHHKAYDWQHVVQHSKLIVDTRHVTKGLAGSARVVSL
ncbi:MAG: nucleotide sugar dehydrogenase [Anaerolineae bacterium]|nr:nucleotide sugar dehydrogenase [Anaerolineae bacterium]MDW8171807.1 nucleotide sugar dehydrogenase [Anaerolineae bacterium]